MAQIIAIEFSTLDGVVEDPDGAQGTPNGGWAFRHGRAAIDGDKFRLGEVLEEGVMLFGRATWQHFSRLWPNRSDDFSQLMNRTPKLVATRSPAALDLSVWSHSTALDGELLSSIDRLGERPLVVVGSISIVHALAAADLIDEYRIRLFPDVLGSGRRLFADDGAARRLTLVSAEPIGPTVLLRYVRDRERTGGTTKG